MWITRVSIANPVFAVMTMAALCVLGLFAYARLGVEQLPDVSPPGAYRCSTPRLSAARTCSGAAGPAWLRPCCKPA